MTPNSPIQEALARTEIKKVLAQHARGIDRADEALLRRAYHDDGTVDYGSLLGSAAEFAAAIAAMHRGAPLSLHRPSNVWIRVAGDAAISESYVAAWVTLPTDGEPAAHLVGGRYLDRHRRRQGAWRMQHRHYVLDWIIQYTEPGVAGGNPAFNLERMAPMGGHYSQDPGNALLLAYAAEKHLPEEKPVMDEAEALDRVVSNQAIEELGYAYARGVDRGDPDTIMRAFHDDATIVAGVFNGAASDFAVEVGKILDKVAPRVAHTVTNHWIEIDGNSAVGESYVLSYQNLVGDEPKDVLTGGRYIDRYERRDGVWKIAQRTAIIDWSTASPAKNLLASGMFKDMVKGQRGREDPVFAHWESLGPSPA